MAKHRQHLGNAIQGRKEALDRIETLKDIAKNGPARLDKAIAAKPDPAIERAERLAAALERGKEARRDRGSN